MIVKREESVNRLVRLMGNGNVKAITGIRRCGKSFLLFRLFREHLIRHVARPAAASALVRRVLGRVDARDRHGHGGEAPAGLRLSLGGRRFQFPV